AVILIAGSLSGLVVSALRYDEQVGVVRSDVTLRRIPGSDADGWLPVTAGSAVEVVAGNGGFLLVRTVVGLEGWLKLDELLWPGSPIYPVLRFRGYVL
ncbi:MAG: hypothetical protein ACOC1I_06380, partial [Spirochaetota bacterium]